MKSVIKTCDDLKSTQRGDVLGAAKLRFSKLDLALNVRKGLKPAAFIGGKRGNKKFSKVDDEDMPDLV